MNPSLKDDLQGAAIALCLAGAIVAGAVMAAVEKVRNAWKGRRP